MNLQPGAPDALEMSERSLIDRIFRVVTGEVHPALVLRDRASLSALIRWLHTPNAVISVLSATLIREIVLHPIFLSDTIDLYPGSSLSPEAHLVPSLSLASALCELEYSLLDWIKRQNARIRPETPLVVAALAGVAQALGSTDLNPITPDRTRMELSEHIRSHASLNKLMYLPVCSESTVSSAEIIFNLQPSPLATAALTRYGQRDGIPANALLRTAVACLYRPGATCADVGRAAAAVAVLASGGAGVVAPRIDEAAAGAVGGVRVFIALDVMHCGVRDVARTLRRAVTGVTTSTAGLGASECAQPPTTLVSALAALTSVTCDPNYVPSTLFSQPLPPEPVAASVVLAAAARAAPAKLGVELVLQGLSAGVGARLLFRTFARVLERVCDTNTISMGKAISVYFKVLGAVRADGINDAELTELSTTCRAAFCTMTTTDSTDICTLTSSIPESAAPVDVGASAAALCHAPLPPRPTSSLLTTVACCKVVDDATVDPLSAAAHPTVILPVLALLHRHPQAAHTLAPAVKSHVNLAQIVVSAFNEDHIVQALLAVAGVAAAATQELVFRQTLDYIAGRADAVLTAVIDICTNNDRVLSDDDVAALSLGLASLAPAPLPAAPTTATVQVAQAVYVLLTTRGAALGRSSWLIGTMWDMARLFAPWFAQVQRQVPWMAVVAAAETALGGLTAGGAGVGTWVRPAAACLATLLPVLSSVQPVETSEGDYESVTLNELQYRSQITDSPSASSAIVQLHSAVTSITSPATVAALNATNPVAAPYICTAICQAALMAERVSSVYCAAAAAATRAACAATMVRLNTGALKSHTMLIGEMIRTLAACPLPEPLPCDELTVQEAAEIHYVCNELLANAKQGSTFICVAASTVTIVASRAAASLAWAAPRELPGLAEVAVVAACDAATACVKLPTSAMRSRTVGLVSEAVRLLATSEPATGRAVAALTDLIIIFNDYPVQLTFLRPAMATLVSSLGKYVRGLLTYPGLEWLTQPSLGM